jgi:hypothetical protein
MKTNTLLKWTFALVVVGLVLIASAARAQTNLSFLTSKAALRAYAVAGKCGIETSCYNIQTCNRI